MNSPPRIAPFASIPAHSVRADIAGGGLSSDFGLVLLRGVDLQIGLTKRIAAALHLKDDLAADRTSRTNFLANCMRLLLHATAYVLHQQLRTQVLQHTALPPAQPSTVISKLFKIAVGVRQCKNKIVLHLSSARPAKQLLQTLTADAGQGPQLVLSGPRPVRREVTIPPLTINLHVASSDVSLNWVGRGDITRDIPISVEEVRCRQTGAAVAVYETFRLEGKTKPSRTI